MDPNRVGKFILDLRKKNNLTQQQFADMFGVTYQAVSKWENGKNIPDILILKDMCKKFNVDINEILDGEKQKKKINYLLILIALFFLIIVSVTYLVLNKGNDFEFKTLTASCDNFTISGSVAYNSDKSSIYIADVTYCGGDDTNRYDNIECILYESGETIDNKISHRSSKENSSITLEEFLKDITFNIDNYKAMCESFSHTEIFLQINATKNNNITSYKIPLQLQENCSAK